MFYIPTYTQISLQESNSLEEIIQPPLLRLAMGSDNHQVILSSVTYTKKKDSIVSNNTHN